jgi:plastocyanin
VSLGISSDLVRDVRQLIMIKPGDIIEWTYKKTGNIVVKDEELWSTLAKSWCQIGSGHVHTCIACDGETITWLNSKGLFHTHVDDALTDRGIFRSQPVVPRVKQ